MGSYHGSAASLRLRGWETGRAARQSWLAVQRASNALHNLEHDDEDYVKKGNGHLPLHSTRATASCHPLAPSMVCGAWATMAGCHAASSHLKALHPPVSSRSSHLCLMETLYSIGVFGNNWLFFVPTSGHHAGEVFPFAYGPTRCEMTGPTFVGNTLIISVQHPGEDCDFQLAPSTLKRDIETTRPQRDAFHAAAHRDAQQQLADSGLSSPTWASSGRP